MKRMIGMIVSAGVWLYAQKVSITKQQEQNWDIKVQKPQLVTQYPFGEFMAEAVTPPTQMQAVTLPFEATILKLHVAKFQHIRRGDTLAEVTGTEWIEVQRQAIADAIEYRHHKHLMERKLKLCKEEIIPKKECTAAKAEYERDKIKIESDKALLRSYGAKDEHIRRIIETLRLTPTIRVISPSNGNIVELRAVPGRRIASNEPLFVVNKGGTLWLEAHIEAFRALKMKEGEKVLLHMLGATFQSQVLQLSSVINPKNQTRQVRFALPPDLPAASGLTVMIRVVRYGKALKIHKRAVIKKGGARIVFVREKDGFIAVPVNVLAEDDEAFYVEPSARLRQPIAISSVAVLKNLLGQSDE